MKSAGSTIRSDMSLKRRSWWVHARQDVMRGHFCPGISLGKKPFLLVPLLFFDFNNTVRLKWI